MTKQSRHKGIEERTGSDGKMSYRAKVRVKGFPAQSGTFARLTDAVRWRQQVEADIRRGKYFQTAEARKHTFCELVDRYIETVLPKKPKSEKKQTAQLLWWKEQIGDRLLSEVTTPLIVEIRDRFCTGITYRGEKRSPATVNRYLAVLSHAFSVAVHEWQWLTESPIKRLKQKESAGRVRFLSVDERDRLLQVCKNSKNKYLYLVVLMALSTGGRLNEIMSLRYSDIQWKENSCRITFRETKNGLSRDIPLVGVARELLATHAKIRRLDTDLLFPATKGFKPRPAVIRAAWEEALERANIEGFTFHSLRHTAASWLGMSNIGGPVISEILGHKGSWGTITKRYTHFSDDHLEEALAKMNDTFLSQEVSK